MARIESSLLVLTNKVSLGDNGKSLLLWRSVVTTIYNDNDLCIITALDECKLSSSKWRKESNQTQLLLGTIRPYKEVVYSIISGSIKTVLMLAGVDINIFKGHATRVASTSKATVSGLSLCKIGVITLNRVKTSELQ